MGGFRGSWGDLGGSWDALGAVLRGSGASWKGLGGSRGVLYEILEDVCKTQVFFKDSLSQRRSKRHLRTIEFRNLERSGAERGRS